MKIRIIHNVREGIEANIFVFKLRISIFLLYELFLVITSCDCIRNHLFTYFKAVEFENLSRSAGWTLRSNHLTLFSLNVLMKISQPSYVISNLLLKSNKFFNF